MGPPRQGWVTLLYLAVLISVLHEPWARFTKAKVWGRLPRVQWQGGCSRQMEGSEQARRFSLSPGSDKCFRSAEMWLSSWRGGGGNAKEVVVWDLTGDNCEFQTKAFIHYLLLSQVPLNDFQQHHPQGAWGRVIW